MDKKIFFFLNFFLSSLFFSQLLLVEYNHTINVGQDLEFKNFLMITPNNESYYLTNDNYDFTKKDILQKTKDIKLTTFIKSCTSSIVEFKWKVPKFKCIVEDFHKFEWKILKENKKILGFNCYKATTTFRGRNWIVYFTYDIPTSFGPWKFKNLPGLVLEAVDSENIFNFVATKIIFNSELEIPSKLLNFFEDNKEKIVDYKLYIKKENEFLSELQSKSISSQKELNLENYDIRIFDIEKSFEWEETKKP